MSNTSNLERPALYDRQKYKGAICEIKSAFELFLLQNLKINNRSKASILNSKIYKSPSFLKAKYNKLSTNKELENFIYLEDDDRLAHYLSFYGPYNYITLKKLINSSDIINISCLDIIKFYNKLTNYYL